MITVFLRGGLGNQMFQYAFGVAVAERSGQDLDIDIVFLNDRFPRREFTYRTYDLGVFMMEPRLTALSRASNVLPAPGLWLALDLAAMFGGSAIGARRILREKDFHGFDPAMLEVKESAITWGNWQNPRYFKYIEGRLRNDFRFREPLAGAAAEIAARIRASDSVSLHVRRGDYPVYASLQASMAQADMAYYAAAAGVIASKVAKPEFFIFSDDIEWCKKNIRLEFPATYVPASAAGPRAAYHLELMSLCKHNIIANSSFSWWAAWLNANPKKMVVAPKRWYVDGRSASGIIPDDWITM